MFTGLVTGGDSAFGIVSDNLDRTATKVTGVDDVKTAVRNKVWDSFTFRGGIILVFTVVFYKVVAVMLALFSLRHGIVKAVFNSEDLRVSIWH